jgi:hypothetical protein
VSRVFEVVGALGWREGVEGIADPSPSFFDSSDARFSHQVFEFGEDLLACPRQGRTINTINMLGVKTAAA